MYHLFLSFFCNEGVYLSLNGDIISNHGYVMISDIGSTDNTALLCHTNRLATLSGSNSGGNWFTPDRTTVAGTDVPGFMRTRGPMVVRLLRNSATGTPLEGVYNCVIEDGTLTPQTVYVGLYSSGGGIIHVNTFLLLLNVYIPSQVLCHYLVM